MKLSAQLVFITISLLPLTTASHAAEKPEWDQQRPNDMPLEKWNTLKGAITSEIKLTAEGDAENDFFGISVSLFGDRALIGAVWDDINDVVDSGSAYVFEYDGVTWAETQKLTTSEGVAGNFFGVSVSLSGDRALIGALWDDDGAAINTGAVYVFEYDGISWHESQMLTASDGAVGDAFGRSVSISGDRALIGAVWDDDKGVDSGAAYVFEYDGMNWLETQKLTASDGAAGDLFGLSVSISGDRALIGAYQDDTGEARTGSAYIYEYNGINWQESQKLIANDGAADDAFGNSVSLFGDRALIGAYQDDNKGGFDSGSAYVFEYDGINWQESQMLTASDGAVGDAFGGSISLSGDRALIGANHINNFTNAGSAYVFEYDGINWQESQILTASDGTESDRFGISVNLSGDRALIGAPNAPNDDNIFINSGSAYVFKITCNSTDIIFCDGFE